jgi:hypothetical protein
VVRADLDGTMSLRQPTLFLDLIASDSPGQPPSESLPGRPAVERYLVEQVLLPFLSEVTAERHKENQIVREHVELSLQEIINRQQLSMAELVTRHEAGDPTPGLAGNVKQAEDTLEELNARLETRRRDLEMEKHCKIEDTQHLGQAWVLPHPEQSKPSIAPMVRDDEIEKIAVRVSMEHEKRNGWLVESVEAENRGFDLISRKPHPEDDRVSTAAKFIEVKGRSAVGEVALSANEYRTAQRLGDDYWLYVVFNCGSDPELHLIRNPAKMGWKPVRVVEQYHVGPKQILAAADA